MNLGTLQNQNINVKRIFNQNNRTRVDLDHLKKVMEARKLKNLPYSLVGSISEEGKLQAVVLYDPATNIPTFAIIY